MPVAEPRAIVSGYGGRYSCAFSTSPARIQLFNQDGGRVYPERSGLFCLTHPDDEGDFVITAMLPARTIFEAAWGRPCAAGTVTEDRIVYDTKGARRPVVSKPVGWNKAPQPAVQLGSGAFVLVEDLWKSAWGQGAMISPGRTPGYTEEN